MTSLFSLNGRTILVTGASSGIGAQIAMSISEMGGRVVLSGRNEERLQATRERLAGNGHVVLPFELCGFASGEELVARASGEAGALAGVVHSAGVMLNRPIRFLSEADLDSVMQINFNAAMGLVKGYRKKNACQPSGGLVLVASVMGLVGQPGLSAYAGSKGALVASVRALSLELAREGLRINCIAPAMVQTEMAEKHHGTLTDVQVQAIRDMHPLGMGTPVDVAHAAIFLLSSASRWVTGSTLVVDGGYTAH